MIVRNSLVLVLLAFGTILFTQCGSKQRDLSAELIENIEMDKRNLADELYTLSANIERKMEEVNRNLTVATDATRQELESIREALVAQKVEVERSIYELENATEQNWEAVRGTSLEVLNEIRISFQDLGNQVSALYEAEAEEME
jgi:hypothetical protein